MCVRKGPSEEQFRNKSVRRARVCACVGELEKEWTREKGVH